MVKCSRAWLLLPDLSGRYHRVAQSAWITCRAAAGRNRRYGLVSRSAMLEGVRQHPARRDRNRMGCPLGKSSRSGLERWRCSAATRWAASRIGISLSNRAGHRISAEVLIERLRARTLAPRCNGERSFAVAELATFYGRDTPVGQVLLRRMRCSGACDGRVGAAWLVTGPRSSNARVKPRRVPLLGPGGLSNALPQWPEIED
jgi:hypothetical protein